MSDHYCCKICGEFGCFGECQEEKPELPEHVQTDTVNHPPHYKSHPSGLECIQVTEHMGFLEGNAIKYIWRHKDKGKPIEDLKKARWYIDRLIKKYELQKPLDKKLTP